MFVTKFDATYGTVDAMKRTVGGLAIAIAMVWMCPIAQAKGAGKSFDGVFKRIAADKRVNHLCFGWSAKKKQLACYEFRYVTEGVPNGGTHYWYVVVRSTDAAVTKPVVKITVATKNDEVQKGKRLVNAAAISQAKGLLKAGGFRAFRGRKFWVKTTPRKVAGIRLRRFVKKDPEGGSDREEFLQIRCKGTWVNALPLGDSYRWPPRGISKHKTYVVTYRTPDGKLLVIYDIENTTYNAWDDNITSARVVHPGSVKGCK